VCSERKRNKFENSRRNTSGKGQIGSLTVRSSIWHSISQGRTDKRRK
jgi:hypothetical protein